MKSILKITTYVFMFLAITAAVAKVDSMKEHILCKHIDVSLKYNSDAKLITEMDVISDLVSSYDTIIGRKIEEINIEDIERNLRKNPVFEKVDVYSNIKGELHINAIQRQPIVRVIKSNGKSFYIDNYGILFPVNKYNNAHILIANGNLNEQISDSITISDIPINCSKSKNLNMIYKVASFVSKHSFFKYQIEQVYINKNGEIELIPKVGDHFIEIGSEKHLEKKFRNLYAFYQKGIGAAGWDTYKCISLKYSNQIVCTKK